MTQKEVIKEMLRVNNKTQKWLADALGCASIGSIASMLKLENITINNLYSICEALGYEIIVQPKNKRGIRPQGQLVLEGKLRERMGE